MDGEQVRFDAAMKALHRLTYDQQVGVVAAFLETWSTNAIAMRDLLTTIDDRYLTALAACTHAELHCRLERG